MTEKKIAIVGTAFSTVEMAPYEDTSWQIWNMGANYARGKRFDRWFEIHDFNVLGAADSHITYLKFMQEIKGKLMIGHAHHLVPEAQLYPVEDIVMAFGDYFTCSAAWMIALAIHEGATEIGLWGVDMTVGEEYGYQKPCVEFYLGMAKGKGIKVSLPATTPIMRSSCLYGFEGVKFSTEFTYRMKQLDKEIDQLTPMKAEVEKKLIIAQAKKDLMHEIAHRWGL